MFWKSIQIKNTENTQIKYNPEKKPTQTTAKRNYPGSVASYDTRPGNEVSLFYNAHMRCGQITLDKGGYSFR